MHYRLIPSERLPYGPVALRLRPDGRVVAAIADDQIDPVLAAELGRVGSAILRPYARRVEPQAVPVLACRIERVATVPVGLVSAEVVGHVLRVRVPRDLLSKAAAAGLSVAATALMQHFSSGL
ncbi:hypothetical protein [Sphaerimonospora thailandensis]|uniref:hypothetical protein n=1 Tax=Sphaerimonospora thailandensis TaxID=795644 RepID=UPI00194ECCB7|nr:hypothetical protein [Sphaerimonospora thailandensis]